MEDVSCRIKEHRIDPMLPVFFECHKGRKGAAPFMYHEVFETEAQKWLDIRDIMARASKRHKYLIGMRQPFVLMSEILWASVSKK